MKKILIFGLPGSGKTTLARLLVDELAVSKKVAWLNADEVRKSHDDWDFSYDGRIRQSTRMAELANSKSDMDFVVCDFVAPIPLMRDNFNADYTIWMDTIVKGRFDDTNKAFIVPAIFNTRITEQDAEKWSKYLALVLLG